MSETHQPGKSKVQLQKPEQVVFTNMPLEADAYYVNADLSDNERRHLRVAWARMNESLDTAKVLLLLPADMTLKQMPTEVLSQWVSKCADILKERGHEVPRV